MIKQDAKKILRLTSYAILFLFITLYSFSRSTDLIFGIKIKKVTLAGIPAKDGLTINESPVKVEGNAKNALELTINGKETSIDQEGNFTETIAIFQGFSIINIKARDKFGYQDEKNYQIIRKN